ncbi:MAG: phage major capsid protein [Candidatus Paceibacterota bacterium]|jgi:HK97 family phage major capsid protein|nr:phage major capsid protein [Candidatus Omnitrophota bacterium]
MKTLQEKMALAIANARTALEAGELEKAKEYREEAEKYAKAIEEMKALDGLSAAQKQEPMRPPLPTAGDPTAPKPDDEPKADPVAKAAYIQQFGEPQDYIKSMLIDLHGKDYEAKYWAHRKAFNRYLRHGEGALSGEERRLLKEVVFTPESIKAALKQGIDDFRVLKSTMVEASDTLGGYVVPIDFQARVIERLPGLTQIRPRATKEQTSRDVFERPVSTGGGSQYPNNVTITWVDETPTAGTAATNLTYGMESIPIHTAMAETFLSRNMLEDAAYNVEEHLVRSFSVASAIDEDNLFLTGDGNGRPEGILPSSTNALSLSYGYNPTSTTAIEWDGLVKTRWTLDAQYRQNAVWIGEKATYEAIDKLKDGEGQYLWRAQYGNNSSATPNPLMGFATLEQEGMPSIATNAYPLIFGDIAGYTIVDRVGMSVERYLDSATARINQVVFVMRRRLGGQVTEPWRIVLYKVATS